MRTHLAIALLLLLAACATQQDTIEIGVITSLSGKASEYGVNVQQGVMLAVEEINSQGGIKGKYLIAIYEDEQCDAKRGIAAARKLVEIDGVSVIVGPMCSAVAMSVAPYLEENGVVMIAPVASAPDLTSIGDHVFRTSVSTTAHARNLATFARSEFGAERAAILYIEEDNGVGYRDDFMDAFTSLGGTVTATESYNQDQRDIRTQILRIEQGNPDVIFIAGQVNLDTILRQLREANATQNVLGISAMESDAVLEAAGELMEDVYYSYAELDSSDPHTRAYLDRYRERFGTESDWFAANAYDATQLLSQAIESCGEQSPCIRAHLHNISDYPGVAGTTTFDTTGEVDKPLVIKTVRNGEFVLY